ncbi:YceI family protein [Zeaxanthinibacter enoshimensis]|uniref:Polyisoprenoid-binding protein YceI n=1 Tax=Zeaxanthinibacter enoshimensis TaxID=392009 RepID=A0A4R6TS29_9FLAO|nr:YceI family protein [Zeaxanthinibacter enoshimensis]TDQ33137.1 polyisoprenoid-binding protein YceI [Zeaxanthinibacter enoshimensis]
MNKLFIFVMATVLLFACKEGHGTPITHIYVSEQGLRIPGTANDTLLADPESSVIAWKGTKMFGLKSHSGIIQLQQGYLVVKDNRPVSGTFTVDMETIEVTDIPDTDPIPKRGLENHLKDPDFFDVVRFFRAHLEISSVQPSTGGHLSFSGLLTMRGITHPVEFHGLYADGQLKALLQFDRFRWDIAYQGSWANRSLIDREVELSVTLVFRPEGAL